jgi:prepilin signal peptidase PulO-like enzyme (type II secretory pathway)
MIIEITVLIYLGLCFGSFVNALVWRLHKQESATSSKQKAKYSISSGRSRCVHCKHSLSSIDLIPVVSWLLLRGKCRYCHKPISSQYPLVETATAALFVISYIYWPGFEGNNSDIGAWLDFSVWLISLVGFVALVVYDLRWMLLPNRIIFPLLVIAGLNAVGQSLLSSDISPLISAGWGILIGGGIFYLLFQISNGRWIGGGDVKLGFLLGILIGGPTSAFLMIFLASVLGSIYSVPFLIKGKLTAKARIPFGPFLIAAAIITKLYGGQLIDWYSGSFLL